VTTATKITNKQTTNMRRSKMKEEIRAESSIAITARVSLVDLAKMDNYFMTKEGVQMRSMSQLVNWCVGAIVEVIEDNGKMPSGIGGVTDAYNYMVSRGLFQRGMMKRNMKKLGLAMGYESMRKRGVDPRMGSRDYNELHNNNSVKAFEGRERPIDNEGWVGPGTGINFDEVFRRNTLEKSLGEEYSAEDSLEVLEEKLRRKEEREMKEAVKRDIENARAAGILAEDNYHDEVSEKPKKHSTAPARLSEEEVDRRLAEQEKRHKEIIEKENAPVDVEWLKKNAADGGEKDCSNIERTNNNQGENQ
jgi:hypothetical protein